MIRSRARGPAALLLAPALALMAAPHVSAQAPQEILAEAMERHEARLADVDDITIHQEIMGITAITYLVKEMVDGSPVLRPLDVDAPGLDTGPMEDIGDLWADPRMLYMEMGDRWTLEGSGSIDGRPTWRLLLTEIDDVDWGPSPTGQGELRADRIELELDADELIPLVMTMEGAVDADGETMPFSLRVELSEYREVSGYLHPHVTSIETDIAAAGLSPEEVAEARDALENLMAELQEMPEGQRALMQEALAPQIRMLEEMLAGDSIVLEVRVTDLRVNEGPPGAI